MSRYQFPTKPKANPEAVVSGDKYRFTVLTDRLIRYEWAEDGIFEDRASCFAINRDFPVPEFRVVDREADLEIITKYFHLTYNKKDFTTSGLNITFQGTTIWMFNSITWRYDGKSSGDLGGTARTLDFTNGPIPLEPGVCSRTGIACMEDSESMLFEDDGWIGTRKPGNRKDGYVFLYGDDYLGAVKALHALSGKQPLIPRWALGNWWSRYYAYSADEYLSLMDEFTDKEIPLSVAVIDMDWHITDVPPQYGTGWTGYTWNRKLFPDPAGFLAELHKRKLKVTLNDHPADGVRIFEDKYEDMAKALGIDHINKEPIPFDPTNRKFLDAFFDVLKRKIEGQGCDFWWLDWQQGSSCRIEGIDPLWILNHYQYLDSARDNKRPVTFSRFAGPGSHRYPIGFSGDTHTTWKELHWQPEFTATASNVGYGWWSHDIGGHMHGGRDDELSARWVQFGMWSPILRLHSSNNPFNSKEPWLYDAEASQVMKKAMILRHSLIPYLYTANARGHVEDEPLLMPMYWKYPRSRSAYAVPNQYFFGSELIVAPVTTPRSKATHLARTRVWLPPGRHIDIFSGDVYDGSREFWAHRTLAQTPVFAREGSIIPLGSSKEHWNGAELPTDIHLIVVVGQDGSFELLEDEGTGADAHEAEFARTPIKWEQASGKLTIGPVVDDNNVIPYERKWTVHFLGCSDIRLEKNEAFQLGHRRIRYNSGNLAHGATVTLSIFRDTSSATVIQVGENLQLDVLDVPKRCYPIVYTSATEYDKKSVVWEILEETGQSFNVRASKLLSCDIEQDLKDALVEVLLADRRIPLVR
ncbi:glycoside hydrolase family 31 protein [Patellaria atrata CBS 101060]|uniref:alpha-glucosidase n=1 Tax=Patellaria atrata CBS 101060 TaxID=1346257 RepID=A0A9P4S6V9_9PEZI|nr:glycoside hydrolase family 31 protein [Patellaria atrata CBS 101060]